MTLDLGCHDGVEFPLLLLLLLLLLLPVRPLKVDARSLRPSGVLVRLWY